MSSGYAASLYAVWKTLEISLPTVADALRGRLTIEIADQRIARWSKAVVEKARIQLTVEGLERVPPGRAYVVMSNHQSHFDVPILYRVWPGTLRMVAKAELFRVPIFGRAMREAGFIRVERAGHRSQAETAMREAAAALGRGVSIWIAPEGTRSADGRLGRFKRGGFFLARDTATPIVPIAIDGSRHVLPKNASRVTCGVPVRVTVGAPIEPIVDGARRPTEALMAEVRDFLAAHLVSS